MKKLLLFLFVFAVWGLGSVARAQMMGNTGVAVTPADTAETLSDEAAGKAIWDKVQNKEVSCQGLKDDDFDVLGDFFMGNMAGTNHATMNAVMTQNLGEAGEKQMHIWLGKKLSGCDTSAAWPMMGTKDFGRMMGRGPVVQTTGGSLGCLWLIGWLFSIGYLGLGFWKGVLALLVWPYYLGKRFAKAPQV
jgi:hypothetical protein